MGRKRSLDTLRNGGEFVSWPVDDPLLGRWYETIKIGSVAWFDRMESEHPTFSFELPGDRAITLRAEEKQRGTLYWVAYKRRADKLRKQYIGRTDALTYERMRGACLALNEANYQPLRAAAKVTQQSNGAPKYEAWTADQFVRRELSGILKGCQQEFKKRYGYAMPWESVELRGRDYYAMPGNQFLGKRARAIRALLQWVNTGRDNAAARRDGAS